jgi:hypothetical protein
MASGYDVLPAPTEEIGNYGRLLFAKLEDAAVVPYRKVLEDGWEPEMNKCHHNAGIWVERHPEHFQVLGWLVIDFRPGDSRVRFLAHSVIEDETGVRFDITPTASTRPRGFIPCYISAEDFMEMEATLQAVYQVGGFDYFP